MTERICTRCRKAYDMEQGGTEKRCSACREYMNKKQKEKYVPKKREIKDPREYYKKYYEKNKERIIEDSKKRYEEKREEWLEYGKQYREKNKERISEYQKQYREKNKAKNAEYQKKYRERKKMLKEFDV